MDCQINIDARNKLNVNSIVYFKIWYTIRRAAEIACNKRNYIICRNFLFYTCLGASGIWGDVDKDVEAKTSFNITETNM
jgi:hypothetical protein